VTLLDDAVFDCPWLPARQVGRWALDDDATRRLGEYLARGGFLVVDDFHGGSQWRVFAETMARVLPGARITDIGADDPLLHVLYELDRDTQIPGRRHLVGTDADGRALARMPGGPPRWRALRDGDGRLSVAINFDLDMGDAWEHADDPGLPRADDVARLPLRHRLPAVRDDTLSRPAWSAGDESTSRGLGSPDSHGGDRHLRSEDPQAHVVCKHDIPSTIYRYFAAGEHCPQS